MDPVALKQAEDAFRDLIASMERDRDSTIQRNPALRRDLDNALGAARSALEHLTHGRPEVARNLWTRNPALRAVTRQYDDEADRITAALT